MSELQPHTIVPALQASSLLPTAANDNITIANDNDTSHKRRKSLGEHLFNLSTYAGVTWLGNEASSVLLWDKWIGKEGTSFNSWYTRTTKELSPFMKGRAKTLALTAGGTLMVPIVKALEDNKGALVRTADGVLEGGNAEQDPRLQKAYHDMDTAPKQSWGSLFKSRLLVMGLAIGLDGLTGDDHSPSYALLKNTRVEKYSTLNRIGTSVARDASRIPPLSWFVKTDTERNAIQAARKADSFTKLAAEEGKAVNLMGGTFGFVLVLSAMLSAIFYASSRVFAAKRDEKEQRKEVIHELEEKGVIPPARHHFLDKETATETAAGPSSAISQASHEKTVAPKPELERAGV